MMETQAQADARDKARAYLRAKGTETPARVIAERVRAALTALDTCFEAVPADRAGVRTLEGEWSVQEIADHVLETHRPSLDELRCVLTGRRPPGGPIPANLQSKAPLLRPWPRLLRDLRQIHEDLVTTLAAVPAEFTTEARAPVVMVVNVSGPDGGPVPYEWIEELDWKAYSIVLRLHAVDHLHQAKKVLAAGLTSRA
jgi:hypothetical protein